MARRRGFAARRSAPRSGAFGEPRRVPVDARLAAAAARRSRGRRAERRADLGGNATADDTDVDAGARGRAEPEVPGLQSAPRRAAPGDEDAAEAHFAAPAPAAGDGGSVVLDHAREARRRHALGAAEVLTPVAVGALGHRPGGAGARPARRDQLCARGQHDALPRGGDRRGGGAARPLATSRVMAAEKVAATAAPASRTSRASARRGAALQAAGVRTAAELAALTDERMAAMARAGLPLKVLKASVDAARELLAAEQ